MNKHDSYASMSDPELLTTVGALAADERRATAALIRALAEVDARRLYLGEGCSSLFTYCTQVLHLSEHAAYNRIEAARAGRHHPIVFERLADGSITLTTITLLSAHLTDGNCAQLLNAAAHKSRRDVERIVAGLRPQAPVPAVIRKLPAPRSQPSPASHSPTLPVIEQQPEPSRQELTPTPARPAVLAPLAPDLYKIQVTVPAGVHDKLRRAQDLLRHSIPNGDLAVILDRALTLLLDDIARRKCAATPPPRARTTACSRARTIPAAVRREVWKRDGGQCAFTGTRGRCTERGFLEFHHVTPFAAGGEATAGNIELRCRRHNVYEAELFFGWQ
jgi:hypothetical protein